MVGRNEWQNEDGFDLDHMKEVMWYGGWYTYAKFASISQPIKYFSKGFSVTLLTANCNANHF